MDIHEAVKEAIRQNPQIKSNFEKNPKAANKLIGVVRGLGCMADPKAVKKLIYEEFGAVWEESEKKEEKKAPEKEPSGWFLWRNKETGEIVREDFGWNEKGTAVKVGILWIHYSKYPNPSRTIGDFKMEVDEWVEQFEHIDTGRSYDKAEYIRRFTGIKDKDYELTDNH